MVEIKAAAPTGRFPMAWLTGALAALLLTMSVSACNTMEGAGKDVSAAGDAVSDSAEDVKDKM